MYVRIMFKWWKYTCIIECDNTLNILYVLETGLGNLFYMF